MTQNPGTLKRGTSQIKRQKPTLLKDLLAGNDLSRLVQRARQAGELDSRVRALLPAELGRHVTGAVLRDDTVTVLVDSAAWACRLRFLGPELAKSLSPRYDGLVKHIRVKVRPPAVPAPLRLLRPRSETARRARPRR